MGVVKGRGRSVAWRAGPVAAGASHGRSVIAPVGPSYGATRPSCGTVCRLLWQRAADRVGHAGGPLGAFYFDFEARHDLEPASADVLDLDDLGGRSDLRPRR